MQLIESAFREIQKVWRERFNGNFVEAAAFFGVKYQTFHSWMTRPDRIPSWRTLAPALEKLNATIHIPGDEINAYKLVKKVIARAGAGSSLLTSGEIDGMYAFRADFFEKSNLSATSCILLEVFGDSMRPTLQGGDLILVDTNDQQIVDGKIFLLTFREELLVKRVYHASEGVLLRSDNHDFPDRTIPDPDPEQFRIHGRVRWVGKEL